MYNVKLDFFCQKLKPVLSLVLEYHSVGVAGLKAQSRSHWGGGGNGSEKIKTRMLARRGFIPAGLGQ
jgi:hypothetical protein